LLTFLLLLEAAVLGVVNNDLVNLLPVVLLFDVDLFVESVELFLKFFYSDLLKLNLTFQLFIFVEKFFILGRELIFLDLKISNFFLKFGIFFDAISLSFLYLIEKVLVPSYQLFSRFFNLSQLRLERSDLKSISLRFFLFDSVPDLVLLLNVLNS
jgi:hypothetical protein